MKKFNVYSNEVVYYMKTIEAETEEEARLKADEEGNFDLGEDDVLGYMDSDWHIEYIVEDKE